ncbi:hypothetical protein [Pontixanthobacter aquaemixtae]|uniref:Uncharacterized protein n=1 Tax=Pontixanthobacter aquaemixtae TaxID=1958940 RepID=A0A844ZP14_9SPHN|nr:hypothetical protein [Pontixanthobacter aquaemixtae]MXO89473.1 hypothetical protein [Pontixanthobacter aquaemixtae]
MNIQNVFAKMRALSSILAPAILLASGAQPVHAQTERYVAESARQVEPARPVGSIVPQEQIASSIDLGRIIPNEGGLIGALIDRTPEKLAQNAAAKADGFFAPLRDALDGFDANALASSATSQAVAQTVWFGAGEPALHAGTSMAATLNDEKSGRADSTVSMTYWIGAFATEANDTVGALTWEQERQQLEEEFAAQHPDAKELALVTWRYQLSADFTNMQVIADLAIRRQNSSVRLYEQQLISIVKLRRPSFVEEENVALWAANDGALARRALEMAFARAGEVLPAILALDEGGYKDAISKKDSETATSAGFHGPVLMRDAKGPVFYARDGDQRLKAFVTVQTIRN